MSDENPVILTETEGDLDVLHLKSEIISECCLDIIILFLIEYTR